MKRKVIKQGNNTLTITLPREWTDKFKIIAGDELSVLYQERGLILNCDKIATDSKTEINIKGLPLSLVFRYILSAYRSGYDEIKVNFSKEEIDKPLKGEYKSNYDYMFGNRKNLNAIDAIQLIVNRLIGLAITDQKENYCIIKELSDTSYKEFDAAVRRMFLLLLSMAEECKKAVDTKDFSFLNNIENIDYNFNRFHDFALRVLNKKGHEKFRKTPTIYALIFILELIADEYKKIAGHLRENKKIGKELHQVFDIQYNQLRRMYELFYTFDKEKCKKITEEDLAGDKINRQIFMKLSDEDKELLHHFKKVGVYVLSTLELTIDMNT